MSADRPLFDRLKSQLAERGFELTDLPPDTGGAGGHVLEVSASRRHGFDRAPFGKLDVLIPVSLRLKLDAGGNIASLSGGNPSTDDIQAASSSLDDLIANQQLDDPESATRSPRATHTIERGSDGSRVVRRRRFNTAAPGRTA